MSTVISEGVHDAAPTGAANTRSAVLSGVDGTGASNAAVLWAARDAAARGTSLLVVHAWAWIPLTPWTTSIDSDAVAQLRQHSGRVLADARDAALVQAEITVDVESVEGAPFAVLSDAAIAGDAAVIVVGHRDLAAAERAIHRSTGSCLAARATRPVVVVRPSPKPGFGTVVIAIAADHADGRLLAFGFDYARRHHVAVRVVTCWHHGITSRSDAAPHDVHVSFSEYVSRWRDDYPDVPVTLGVRTDDPVDALIEESANAELLVVGRRSHQLHLPALLGSVSRAVLNGAHCSVAVLPPRPDLALAAVHPR